MEPSSTVKYFDNNANNTSYSATLSQGKTSSTGQMHGGQRYGHKS